MSDGNSGNAEPRLVTRLVVGERIFESTGYVIIKTTHQGVPEYLKLPIKSAGIAEVLDRMKVDEPKPPARQQMVKGDTDVGRFFGVPQSVEGVLHARYDGPGVPRGEGGP